LSLPATFAIDPIQSDNIVRTIDYAWLSDIKTSKNHTIATALDLNAPGAGQSHFEDFTLGTPSFFTTKVDFNCDTSRTFDGSSFYGMFDAL
jgi:hypothetical protein